MFQYQQTPYFFAQVAGGLEEEAARELTELGARDVKPAYRGVHFEADAAALYRAAYCARLPTHLLAPLVTFDCHSDRYLYKTVGAIPWDAFMRPDDTFAVFANVSNSVINHSKYAALRVKDAIVDQFRDAVGRRPSIDTRAPDVWVALHIAANRATLSVAASAGSMHRRGYRTAALEAPMQETVAAAILRWSEWDGERPLCDPLCGSGTLLCEALMRYSRIPAAFRRARFGFERLPDFQPEVWARVRQEADARRRPLPPGLIAGSDLDSEAVRAARENAGNLPGGGQITLGVRDLFRIPALENQVIVCNPPYGLRMGRSADMPAFYQALGDFFKQRCKGSTAFVYFGDRALLKAIGLRPTWKRPLVSGALDGRLARFDLY